MTELSRLRYLYAFVLLQAIPFLGPAAALPVEIGIESKITITQSAAAQLFSSKLQPCLTKLNRQLAAELRGRPFLGYWQYAIGGKHSTQLHFTVFDSMPDTISLRLEVILDGETIGYWEEDWLTPPELVKQGYDQIFDPNRISQAVLHLLFKPQHEAAIRKTMGESIPLAEGGQWAKSSLDSPPQWIVLPIPFQKFQHFKRGYFRVVCDWSRIHVNDVELDSAAGGPTDYQESGASYAALAVIPERRRFRGVLVPVMGVWKEVLELKPLRTYLEPEEVASAPRLESLEGLQ